MIFWNAICAFFGPFDHSPSTIYDGTQFFAQDARERYLKSGMGKRYLKTRLKDYLEGPTPLESLWLSNGVVETGGEEGKFTMEEHEEGAGVADVFLNLHALHVASW